MYPTYSKKLSEFLSSFPLDSNYLSPFKITNGVQKIVPDPIQRIYIDDRGWGIRNMRIRNYEYGNWGYEDWNS